MELYDNDTIAEQAFARVLVLGPAKAGKTTAIAKTAPKPLILNCDGSMATKGASNQGAKFKALDINSKRDLDEAIKKAAELVEAGEVQTILWDTVSLCSDMLTEDAKTKFTGWDIWSELQSNLIGAYKNLAAIPAHLFLICHMTPDYDGAAGVMPEIGGKSKTKLPALIDDWIFLDIEVGRKPHERMFLLGPQKCWNHSGRNIKKVSMCEATVPALFEQLGIAL